MQSGRLCVRDWRRLWNSMDDFTFSFLFQGVFFLSLRFLVGACWLIVRLQRGIIACILPFIFLLYLPLACLPLVRLSLLSPASKCFLLDKICTAESLAIPTSSASFLYNHITLAYCFASRLCFFSFFFHCVLSFVIILIPPTVDLPTLLGQAAT